MNALRALVPYLAYAFITFVGWTSRVRIEGAEHRSKLRRSKKPFIYAFWHQRQVIFTYTHRGDGPPHILVSRSRDGELIARTMTLSKIAAVRGSSSRGAARAARELLTLVENGKEVGITPDGPKGPARQVKEGVLYLALKSGAPILPISSAVSRRLELKKAWDRYHVPLPFSRIGVVYGKPIQVREQDELPKKADEVARVLDRLTEEAESLVR